ncbi:xylulokinase, partial [Ruminococcaceae bacterium OttesenSCG-928-D13]|nr:xylulokinase [Ruminococcaceae bacterium OttesenSCG-928-D13]
GVIFAHSDKVTIDPQGRVHTFCAAVPGAWTVMSCTLAAGGSLQWFRNNFCAAEMQVAEGLSQDPYVLMDQQAACIPIGADRLLFLPYIMGERSPLLDPDARGVFFGLSGVHTRQHLLRAVMEGVVYSQRECLDVLREMQVPFTEMLATGGGGRSGLWRQMMADLYSCPVVTVQNKEGPALGAAILAGVGAGLYKSVPAACEAIISTNAPQQPIAENCAAYEPFYRLYRQLYPQVKGSFADLAKL